MLSGDQTLSNYVVKSITSSHRDLMLGKCCHDSGLQLPFDSSVLVVDVDSLPSALRSSIAASEIPHIGSDNGGQSLFEWIAQQRMISKKLLSRRLSAFPQLQNHDELGVECPSPLAMERRLPAFPQLSDHDDHGAGCGVPVPTNDHSLVDTVEDAAMVVQSTEHAQSEPHSKRLSGFPRLLDEDLSPPVGDSGRLSYANGVLSREIDHDTVVEMRPLDPPSSISEMYASNDSPFPLCFSGSLSHIAATSHTGVVDAGITLGEYSAMSEAEKVSVYTAHHLPQSNVRPLIISAICALLHRCVVAWRTEKR